MYFTLLKAFISITSVEKWIKDEYGLYKAFFRIFSGDKTGYNVNILYG